MEQRQSSIVAMYLIVLVAAGVLYVGTCAPGSLWQDPGMFQYRMLHNDIEGSLGLALAHPLYHLIGIGAVHIDGGDPAYKVNLISAIAGAITAANIFLIIRLWLQSTGGGLLAAATLAFSHTFWQHATIAQPYTLIALFITTELLVVLQYIRTGGRGWLYLLAFVNGVAISNHMFASITCAVYAVFVLYLIVRRRLRPTDVAVMAGLWIIGASLYEYLIIKEMVRSGQIGATLASAIFGDKWRGAVLNTALSLKVVKENVMLFGLNCPSPTILFFFAGVWCMYRAPQRAFGVIVSVITLLFFVFAFRYSVPDRYKFFLPFYCMAAIVLGAGFALSVSAQRQRWLSWIAIAAAVLLPVIAYWIAPGVAERRHVPLGLQRAIPYRNEYVYFLRPWQCGNDGPQRFADEALKTAGDNAIIYADGTTVYPLLYEQQVKGKYTNVTVITSHASANNMGNYKDIDKFVAQRPFYVVSPVKGYIPAEWLEKYSFKQQGVLWRMNFKGTQESK